MGRFNFIQHKYLLGVYNHLVLFCVGYVAGFSFKSSEPDAKLTINGWRLLKEEKMLHNLY